MAEESFTDIIPARNAETHARHRKDVFWQITVPLGLGLLALLAVCVLTAAAAAGGSDTAHWRDISLIWVLAPGLLFALIPLVLLAGLSYAVFRLIQFLPAIFYKIQRFTDQVREQSARISDRITAPGIRLQGLWAGLRKIRK